MMIYVTLSLAAALALTGCSAGTEPPDTTMAELVHELPFSQGQGFATLDAYLAHLERLSAQDRPWYQEIEPGRYRLVGGRRAPSTQADERIYTREDLMTEFGFTE
jgi:hypothetical protein